MSNRFKAEQQTVRKSRAIIHRRYLIRETIITLVVASVILFFGVQLFHAYEEKVTLKRQVRNDQIELVKQRRLARSLRLNVRQLHSQKYVERLLSQRFSYSKSGEIVYNLPGNFTKGTVNH